jgi:RHS repeat-associated protein
MITDATGIIAEKRQFDAWGNIVKLENGNGVPLTAFVILDRGYTGHEHLLGVGLIHMNGRLYDPKLHRFLQPDNYVLDPYNSQNFNRYGYVYNNPLSHVDPSGEFIVESIIIGASIFAYLGGTAANNGQFNPFKWEWNSKTWAGIGIGAVVGGLGGWGFAVGGPALAGSSFFTSFANGPVVAYGITGTVAAGAAGYVTGFGTGMVNSGGDWRYANQLGTHYAGIGAAIGSVLGTLYGLSDEGRKYLDNLPKKPYNDTFINYASIRDKDSEGQGGFNNPGGSWDSWGVGSVPYHGKAWMGTNFIGPGPNKNPYRLGLRPIDAIDAAALRHDYAYWKAGVGGVSGALFSKSVTIADFNLAYDALMIINSYKIGGQDYITRLPISRRTYNIASAVYYLFGTISINKLIP